MPVTGSIIRPPAEAESFLLQVTVGCSMSGCAFCAAYADKTFRGKPPDEIGEDIARQAAQYPGTRRIFLLDGDALALPNRRILPVLDQLRQAFPALSRVGSYANAFNITARTDAELQELSDRNLRLVYIGLESGSQRVLDLCQKRVTAAAAIEAVPRAARCGIKSTVMVLVGLGGREYSAEHVRETVTALNRMQPRYVSLLSLMLIDGTPLSAAAQAGMFTELSAPELLAETREILAGLVLEGTVFRSNHASNFLPLEGRLPRDKRRLLAELDQALAGVRRLRPQWQRGL